jgi:hypothetical protein
MRPLVALVALVAAMAALLIAYNTSPARAADSCQPSGSQVVCTFEYTGAAQSWTVPDGVSQATFDVFGAQGGSEPSGKPGGLGGEATATIAVNPGDTLQVNVGGAGGNGTTTQRGPGGFNGGASGGSPGGSFGAPAGGGGGGASDVRSGAFGLANRIIVAGGGGGAGGFGGAGGVGGGLFGTAGGDATSVFGTSGGGGGGTSSAGGSGGAGSGGNGGGGGSGFGGFGGSGSGDGSGGGGGGGGYYGGGGGGGGVDAADGGGGGGGSGFGPSGVVFDSGVREGNGLVTITYTVTPVNEAPTVAVDRGGQCGPSSDMRGTIDLALSDPDTPAQDLTLSATSSNRAVVPNGAISFRGGTDASRTMTVGRLTGSGTSTLTVTVSDGDREGSVVVRVISGSAANDALPGGDDSDMIFGRKGADSLSGLGANDLLCAGNGRDTLTGGAGADHFGGGYGPEDAATDFDAAEGDTKRSIENF